MKHIKFRHSYRSPLGEIKIQSLALTLVSKRPDFGEAIAAGVPFFKFSVKPRCLAELESAAIVVDGNFRPWLTCPRLIFRHSLEQVTFFALGGALNSLPQTIHFFIIFRISLKSPTTLRLRGDFIQAWSQYLFYFFPVKGRKPINLRFHRLKVQRFLSSLRVLDLQHIPDLCSHQLNMQSFLMSSQGNR